MAKILKILIDRESKNGGTHYTYPPEYNAKHIQILAYESSYEEDNVKSRGNKDEYVIGVVSDEHVPTFLKNDNISEISVEEANKLGNRWTRQIEKISDEKKVLSILAKNLRGEELTQEDKDAIDPHKEAIGINKTKAFSDSLKEIMAVMGHVFKDKIE